MLFRLTFDSFVFRYSTKFVFFSSFCFICCFGVVLSSIRLFVPFLLCDRELSKAAVVSGNDVCVIPICQCANSVYFETFKTIIQFKISFFFYFCCFVWIIFFWQFAERKRDGGDGRKRLCVLEISECVCEIEKWMQNYSFSSKMVYKYRETTYTQHMH